MYEHMRLEDQLEMRQLRKMLYRAVRELSYIHANEVVPVEHEHLITSSEGLSIVEEGMRILGTRDLSEDDIPFALETA